MESCVVFQVTPMYKNKNIQKIENELMETAPGRLDNKNRAKSSISEFCATGASDREPI